MAYVTLADCGGCGPITTTLLCIGHAATCCAEVSVCCCKCLLKFIVDASTRTAADARRHHMVVRLCVLLAGQHQALPSCALAPPFLRFAPSTCALHNWQGRVVLCTAVVVLVGRLHSLGPVQARPALLLRIA